MIRNRKLVFYRNVIYVTMVLAIVISMAKCEFGSIVINTYGIEQYETNSKESFQKEKIHGEIQEEIQEETTIEISFESQKPIAIKTFVEHQVVEGISEEKLKVLRKETHIGMDICSDINLTKDEFIYVLNNLKYDEKDVLKNNSILIWELSEKYNINPMIIVGIMGLESGYGRSQNAINNNNLFGISNSKDGQKMKSFTSKGECIAYFCKHLSENYLCEDGMYYAGSTKLKDVNIFYNPKHDCEECNCFDNSGQFIELTCNFDFIWSESVVDCMFTFYNNIETT